MPQDIQEGSTSTGTCRWEEGRRVFVKELRRDYAGDKRYQDAFRKEFEIGRTLDCPYLVQYIRMEDDCIVEEYVDGVTLDRFIMENPDYLRKESHLRKFLLQLLEGLRYLHARQILHLDLKPANLLITRVGNSLKIVDFGFSCNDSYIMSPGGTAEFAAPEQKTVGGCLNVTTDIYGVGRILQFMDKEIGLPRRYRQIAEKCCSEDPAGRYQSVDEIWDVVAAGTRYRWFLAIAALSLIILSVFCFRSVSGIPTGVFCVDGIYYRATSDSTLAVVRSDSCIPEFDLVVPERVMYKEYTFAVTSIDSLAYDHYRSLIAITLPKTLDSINYAAFAYCDSIANVYIPDNVSYIGADAFRMCPELVAVRLPEGITSIEKGLFSCCGSIREIDVPASVRVLKQDAFGFCVEMQAIHLHEGLEVIERGVFWECRELCSITIPSTVTEIGDYVFWGCNKLTDVYMMNPVPPRITNIFANRRLRIHVPEGAEQSYRSSLFWKEQEIVPLHQ